METSDRMAYQVPIVSTRYARRFVRFMESKGVGKQAILKDTGISEELLAAPDASLSMAQVIDLLGKAEWLMQEEWAPFQFGQQLDLPAHGLLGFAVLSRDNPRKLVSMIVQYLRVGLPLMDMDLSTNGSAFQIRLVDTWNLGELRPCMTKIYMGSIHRLASLVCDHASIEFDFPCRSGPEAWQGLARNCDFRFEAAGNSISLPLSERPLRNDEEGLEFLLANARSREAAKHENADEFVIRVRDLIMAQPGRACTMENIAHRLDMSPRSLRQHLADAGTSFRELRNEIRQSFATLYLTDTSVPVESIAEKLGFSDQASFTKAFRSWTGMTPGEARRNAREKTS